MNRPELTQEMERTIKQKLAEKKRLTADERTVINYYGEYRFQTPEGQRRIKRELTGAIIKWCLFIPDDMSISMGLVMFGCIAIGIVALLIGA